MPAACEAIPLPLAAAVACAVTGVRGVMKELATRSVSRYALLAMMRARPAQALACC